MIKSNPKEISLQELEINLYKNEMKELEKRRLNTRKDNRITLDNFFIIKIFKKNKEEWELQESI
jgi:hypothetical protein